MVYHVFLGVADGGLQPGQMLGAGAGSFSGIPVDVTGDDILDLLRGTNGSLALRVGDGEGGFGPQRTYPIPYPYLTRGVAFLNVDQDGEFEIIAAPWPRPGITIFERRD